MIFMHVFHKTLPFKYVVSLLFISIILASSITYAIVSATLPTVVIGPAMNITETSYIVFKDGSIYYAKNGLTGAIVYSGTIASTVIQLTFNNMLNGEKVLLKGNFTITTKISIPSHIIIELQGFCTLANNVNNSMFGNTELSTSLPTDIEFFGGVLDGNKANNVGGTQYQYLIDGGYATKVSIHDMQLINFNHMAIRIAGWAITEFDSQGRKPSENFVNNNIIENGGSGVTANDCAIMATSVSSKGSIISNNIIRNINGGGIYLEDRANNILVDHNYIWRVTQNGIFGWYTFDNILSNNIIAEASYGSGASGYFGIGGHSRHHIVKGNIIYGSTIGVGISNDNIQGLGMFNEVEGNTIFDNGNSVFTGYGLTVRGGATYKAQYNKIYGNFIVNDYTYDNFSFTLDNQTFTDYKNNYQYFGISFDANCLYNEVIGNNLLGNYVKIDTPAGASIIKNNIGYLDISSVSYIIFKDGSIYYAQSGTTGTIDFSSTNPTTLVENVLSQIYNIGGEIHFTIANYTFTSTIDVPTGTKNVVFSGESGYGKSYQPQGTTFTSTITNAPLFKVNATSDVRSAYALTFEDIKFKGPNTTGSIALDLSNADTVEIESCTFLKFGISVHQDYIGSSYPLGEQPGKIFAHDNEFAEGALYYIQLIKSTQCHINNNIFESYGNFNRTINLIDSNKIDITSNEFDQPTTPSKMEAFIYITADYGAPYIPCEMIISDNWAYRDDEYPFIKVEGTTLAVYGIFSSDNIIEMGYEPDELTDDGYIVIEDPNYHQVQANDNIQPFSSQVSKLRSHDDWTSGTVRKNLWGPMMVYAKVSIPINGTVVVQMQYNATVWDIMQFINYNLQPEVITLTFLVPTLFYWNVEVSGGATQTGLVVEYR